MQAPERHGQQQTLFRRASANMFETMVTLFEERSPKKPTNKHVLPLTCGSEVAPVPTERTNYTRHMCWLPWINSGKTRHRVMSRRARAHKLTRSWPFFPNCRGLTQAYTVEAFLPPVIAERTAKQTNNNRLLRRRIVAILVRTGQHWQKQNAKTKKL